MKFIFLTNNEIEQKRFLSMFKAHFNMDIAIHGSFKALSEILKEDQTEIKLIIIDDEFSEHDVSEIYSQIVASKLVIPVAMYAPEPRLMYLGLKTFYDDHEDNFLIEKPFNLDQFKELVGHYINKLSEAKLEESVEDLSDEDFLPIKINTFYRIKKSPCPVYIRLGENKYVRVLHGDEIILEGFVDKYKRRKVKLLCLKRDDHLNFIVESIFKFITIFRTKKINAANKIELQIQSVRIIHEHVRNYGVGPDVIDLSLEVTKSSLELAEKLPKPTTIFKYFKFKESDTAKRSVLLSYVCYALLKKMDWKSNLTSSKMSLAAILHDASLDDDDIAEAMIEKDAILSTLSEEELETYKDHPHVAAKVANEYNRYPPDIDFIIEQHHELPTGDGFPKGITVSKINEVSSVFIAALQFTVAYARSREEINLNKILQRIEGKLSQGKLKASFTELKKIYAQTRR